MRLRGQTIRASTERTRGISRGNTGSFLGHRTPPRTALPAAQGNFRSNRRGRGRRLFLRIRALNRRRFWGDLKGGARDLRLTALHALEEGAAHHRGLFDVSHGNGATRRQRDHSFSELGRSGAICLTGKTRRLQRWNVQRCGSRNLAACELNGRFIR